MKTLISVGALIAASTCGISQAQTNASQTAYRCEASGKVTYTDEPCLNGQEVDTTPTKGLNKSTGRTLKGKEVQREELDAGLTKALTPITGGKDYATMRRRVNLNPAQQQECERIDRQRRTGPTPEATLAIRKRYKELGC